MRPYSFFLLSLFYPDPNFYEALHHLKFREGVLPCNGVEHQWACSFDLHYRSNLISTLAPHDLPIVQFEDIFVRPSWLRCPKDVTAVWLHKTFEETERILLECDMLCAKHGIQGTVSEDAYTYDV